LIVARYFAVEKSKIDRLQGEKEAISQEAEAFIEENSGEEQRAIAAVLSGMDAETEALEARRNKTQTIKQGMMQELLTGRTRLI
jgi:type I restriction enzyme, S subunit